MEDPNRLQPGQFAARLGLEIVNLPLYRRDRTASILTLLYESDIDPLVTMKIVGHTDCQTTANFYTHLKEETLRGASVYMEKVFTSRAETAAD